MFLKIVLTVLRAMDKRVRMEVGKPDRRLIVGQARVIMAWSGIGAEERERSRRPNTYLEELISRLGMWGGEEEGHAHDSRFVA